MRGILMTFGSLLLSGCLTVFSNAHGAETDSNWIRWQYAGSISIKANPQATTIKDIWKLPESRRLANVMMDRLAQVPEREVFGRDATAPSVRRRIIKGFVEGLLKYHHLVELNGEKTEHPNLSLAVQLPTSKIETWDRNIRRYLGTLGWKPAETNPDSDAVDWTAAHENPDYLARLVEQGDWLLFSVGPDAHSRVPEWNTEIKAGNAPTLPEGSVLAIRGNLSQLSQKLADTPLDFASQISLQFKAEENGVRTEGTIELTSPIDQPLPSWQPPTKLIADPVVSFSGARGLSPLITQLPGTKTLTANGLPEQIFSWARPALVNSNSIPLFPLYMAWPVPPEKLNIAHLTKRLPLLVGTSVLESGSARLVSFPERNETLLQILPGFINPFLRGATNETHGFRVAGLFPLTPAVNPVPQALIDQLDSQENMVYYQWEITQKRIETYKTLTRFLAFLFQKPQSRASGVALRWLGAVETKMGNAVTIVTAPEDKQLKLVRKSYYGLNGLELTLLAQWIESPLFPFVDKELLSTWNMRSFTLAPQVPAAPQPSLPPVPGSNVKTRR